MSMFDYIINLLYGKVDKLANMTATKTYTFKPPIFKYKLMDITEPLPEPPVMKIEAGTIIQSKGGPFQLEITQADIQQRAYELWKSSNCPSGKDVDFWCQAERELKTQNK